jgi:hypothetical protein
MKDLFRLLKQIQEKSNRKSISIYFGLEESVGQLPWVKSHLEQALEELDELHDQIMLTKRLYALQYADRLDQQSELEKLLNIKVRHFENTLQNWMKRFEEKGFFLRDIQEGIVEFPYKTKDGETLFLCWQDGEEGILYFRESHEPFAFRKPITLLPA